MTVADNCEVSAVACGPSFWTSLTSLLACPVEIVMSEFDIFVSSKSIATLDHMKSLKYITLDGNTGHFDEVIDLAGSEGFGDNIKPQLICSSCSFTDQMLAQLAVLRNLLVNEVYLLPKRLDEKMATLHLPLLVQCSPDARAGKCMVHKLMNAMSSFCGVPG